MSAVPALALLSDPISVKTTPVPPSGGGGDTFGAVLRAVGRAPADGAATADAGMAGASATGRTAFVAGLLVDTGVSGSASNTTGLAAPVVAGPVRPDQAVPLPAPNDAVAARADGAVVPVQPVPAVVGRAAEPAAGIGSGVADPASARGAAVQAIASSGAPLAAAPAGPSGARVPLLAPIVPGQRGAVQGAKPQAAAPGPAQVAVRRPADQDAAAMQATPEPSTAGPTEAPTVVVLSPSVVKAEPAPGPMPFAIANKGSTQAQPATRGHVATAGDQAGQVQAGSQPPAAESDWVRTVAAQAAPAAGPGANAAQNEAVPVATGGTGGTPAAVAKPSRTVNSDAQVAGTIRQPGFVGGQSVAPEPAMAPAAAPDVPMPATQPAPMPATQAAPMPATQAAPMPATQAAPMPATQAAPMPATQAAPVPATQAAPVPATQAAPMPATQAAPLPATQATPMPATQATPMPAMQAAPMPAPAPEPATIPALAAAQPAAPAAPSSGAMRRAGVPAASGASGAVAGAAMSGASGVAPAVAASPTSGAVPASSGDPAAVSLLPATYSATGAAPAQPAVPAQPPPMPVLVALTDPANPSAPASVPDRKTSFRPDDAAADPAQPVASTSVAQAVAAPVAAPADAPVGVAATVAASARPVVHPTGTAEQVAPALVTLATTSGGSQQMTVKLQPAELGMVQIRIDRSPSGAAQIAVTAEKADTLQVLQRDQMQLHLALDQAGIPAAGRTMTFHVVDPAPASSASASDGHAQAGSGGRASADSANPDGSPGPGADRGAYQPREANVYSTIRRPAGTAEAASANAAAAALTPRAGVNITA